MLTLVSKNYDISGWRERRERKRGRCLLTKRERKREAVVLLVVMVVDERGMVAEEGKRTKGKG